MTTELTPEQNDVKERAENFVKEYGELVAKYQIDLANYPMFIPDGKGNFTITLRSQPVDIKDQPKKSPFVANEDGTAK